MLFSAAKRGGSGVGSADWRAGNSGFFFFCASFVWLAASSVEESVLRVNFNKCRSSLARPRCAQAWNL